MPGFPVHQQLTELAIESLMPSNPVILCRLVPLLPSIPPSIRVFSNASAPPIRWPKYWSFSFSISPSSEYPGLISFRTDWLDLLEFQGTQIQSRRPRFSCWMWRSPGEGNGYPLHYSYLENPMDRGAWQTIVHGVAKLDITEQLIPTPWLWKGEAFKRDFLPKVSFGKCSRFWASSVIRIFIWEFKVFRLILFLQLCKDKGVHGI